MKKEIVDYLKKNLENIDAGFLGYIANLSAVAEVAPQIAASVVKELEDQRNNLKLIASENYSSLAVQLAMGNLLTDKYAEGYPYHRFYAGCENIDDIESYGIEIAKRLFNCEHVSLEPHSGADANLIAYWAILNKKIELPAFEEFNVSDPNKLSDEDWNKIRIKLGNQRLLGLDYYSGGHLTHGYRYNVSAKMFEAHTYSVDKETGLLNYDEIERQARKIKPLILLAGYSSYPRLINFKKMREIADEIGAVLMSDISHFAGLVAGGVLNNEFNPVPYSDVITTTTHKTLRGPRGGMILCKEEFAESVDKGCPLVMGGPLPNMIAAKAVALTEASKPEFKIYAEKIIKNAQIFAKSCIEEGLTITTGGTDNHLFLIDVSLFGLTGRQAESVLRECGITLNRNVLPFDKNGPWYTSGLRIGTPAITTLGMDEHEMKEIAHLIKQVIANTKSDIVKIGESAGEKSKAKYILDEKIKQEVKEKIENLLRKFPVYPEIDLKLLQENF